MTRCARCEIWKNNSNPFTHDQICGCECHQAKPVQLLDLSPTEEVENAGNTKSAAQVFTERKMEQIKAKEKMKNKLALLGLSCKIGNIHVPGTSENQNCQFYEIHHFSLLFTS